MKIGIVTVFDSENFGNRLQNYALQRVLEDLGAEVVTIKNKPRFRSLGEFLRRGTPLAESVLLNRMAGKGRKAKILAFQRRYLSLSRRCYCCGKTYDALKEGCDLYCVGSDQVWNPELGRIGGFSFLSFAGDRGFSYAASFGTDTLPAEYQDAFRLWLKRLPHLSLRETGGKGLAETLTDRDDIQVHIDPTLLLSSQDWENRMARPGGELPQAYLLAYFLGALSPDRRKAVSEQAARLGLPVLDIMDPGDPFYNIGPEEFLYLLRHAALVATDSFHGSVFSFLFGRPLVIFDRGTMVGRLDTLVRLFHLAFCRAEGDRIPPVPEQPDYSAGYAVLERERNRAREYLQAIVTGEGQP